MRNWIPLFTLVVSAAMPLGGARADAEGASAHPQAVKGYGKLPMRFEPNVGQFAPEVRYVARGNGYSLALTGQAANLALRNPGEQQAAPVAALRFSLAGARAQPALIAERKEASVSNYFIGKDAVNYHAGVANYGAVRYRGVYPGIDWLVYGNPQQLEYDLVVAPGADPRRIRLQLAGADRLAIDGQGDLMIVSHGRTVTQRKPLVYQSIGGRRREVEGRYRIEGQQVAFELGAYDHARTLTIDPILVYSTYLGGSGEDQINAIAVDHAGSAYVAGFTQSSNFPTAGALQGAIDGGTDAFVAKLNATGTALVYSTYLGGSSVDEAQGIAVDSSGNAYVAGWTGSTDFPVLNAAQAANASTSNGTNAFIVKLDAAGGALVYSTYLGGSQSDEALAIAVDSAGQAYVAGYTYSYDFHTVSPLQAACHSNQNAADAFVAKLSAGGSSMLYSTCLGGSYADAAYAIAVDSSGSAYVAGGTSSGDFPTVNPVQATNGGTNSFISVINPSGTALSFSTYLGGSGVDVAKGIAADSAGNAYVTGWTASLNFPTVNPLQASIADNASSCIYNGGDGCGDAFVARINTVSSILSWSTYLGGSSFDGANGVALDSADNVYVAGQTTSVDFPAVSAFQSACAGPYTFGAGSYSRAGQECYGDAFVAKLNPEGSALLYSTYLGGTDEEIAHGLAVDGAGSAYLGGYTGSSDYPTAVPLQAAAAGFGDAFVAKIGVITLTPTPDPLLFGAVGTGTTSAVKRVTVAVSNGAYAPTAPTLSGTNAGDFAITATTCSGTIASGKTCTVSLTFTPTKSTGTVESATLNLGGNASATVALSGTSSALITVTPNSLSFGSIQVDNSTVSKKVTIRNNQSASLSLNTPSFGAGNDGFDIASGGTCGSSLPPFTSCDYALDFTPTVVGAKTGTFIIQTGPLPTSDPQQFDISLSGTGAVQVTVSPASLAFGTVTVGTTSPAQSVKLTNNQPQALAVNPTISGPGFAFGSGGTCTTSLAPKSSCTINVIFAPTVQGNRSGTLTISDSPDIASPHSVKLFGSGLQIQ